VTSIARKWLDEGIQDRCITRDLEWGIPVPKPGCEGKVFYVWFDAPIEYIAATQEWAEHVAARVMLRIRDLALSCGRSPGSTQHNVSSWRGIS
jgi:methionyl-tRNA synthetase